MATSEAIDRQDPGAAMPPQWRTLLEQTGARFEQQRTSGYGQAQAERAQALAADVMADLSHYGLIEVQGADAQKFLASLFTGDVRLVTPSQGQFTSWCDGKGRMLATFWLFMRNGAYYLLLPAELLAPTLARLRQFLLRSKASIADASGSLVRLGLSGPSLEAKLAALLQQAPPQARGETQQFGECTLVALGGEPQPRWLAVGPAAAVERLWQGLRPGTQPVGAEPWALLDILGGIPQLSPATAGEFIPQMLDLEALGGLCFTKGCYPGQEVIARLHYRGQLKRLMYLAYADSGQPPAAGTKLYGEGTAESIGLVVSAAPHPDGRIALLAVIVIEQKEAGHAIRLADLQGPPLEFPQHAA